MTAIPWTLIGAGFGVDAQQSTNKYGVGMVFLPQDRAQAAEARKILEIVTRLANVTVLGWREVPVDENAVGPRARETIPKIEQVMVKCDEDMEEVNIRAVALRGCAVASSFDADVTLQQESFEGTVYVLRRAIHSAWKRARISDAYICSLSTKTIVYKGMLNSAALPLFYADLKDSRFVTPFAIYHRRFSTNTAPRWPLAQPMRMLGMRLHYMFTLCVFE
jgi:glutamate synthase (ferredoxin)